MDIVKENKILIIFSSLIVFLFIWINISEIHFIHNLRNTLESRFIEKRIIVNRTSWDKNKSDIIIIDIDNDSLAKMGQWPWSGDKLRLLSNKLINSGVALICFDLVFNQKGRNSALEVHKLYSQLDNYNPRTLQTLQNLIKVFDYDIQFAKLLKQHEFITGFFYHKKTIASTGHLPQPLTLKNKIHQRALIHAETFTGNIKIIQDAAKIGGFINLKPDKDGIFRKTPLLIQYGYDFYPALSLQAARIHQVSKKVKIEHDENNAERIRAIYLDELKIPVESNLSIMPTYRGPSGSFPIFSALDIIREKIDLSRFEGKTVIIGSSSAHIRPVIKTLAGRGFMTAEVHANILNSILSKQLINKPAWVKYMDNVFIFIIGLGLSFLLPMLKLRENLLLCTFFCLIWLIYNYWMFHTHLIITSIAIPTLMILALATTNIISRYEPLKFRLIRLFAQLLYKLKFQTNLSEKDKSNETTIDESATIMFLEIQNFAEISDKLDGRQLNRLLNIVVGPISHIIESCHGELSQYIGHILIATWRAGHAADAVKASQLITNQSQALAPKLRQKGYPEIKFSLGINTGKIRFKTLSLNTTILCGQAIAVANKLADLTKFYKINCIIGEKTKNECPRYQFKQIDTLRLNSHNSHIKIFQAIVESQNIDLLNFYEIEQYEKALQHLNKNELTHAKSIFKYLLELRPQNTIYRLYLNRLETLINTNQYQWTTPINRRYFRP